MEFDPNKMHYLTATAIIIKDGKYLIAKRSENEKAMPGLWTVPGGKLEVEDYSKLPKDTGDHWYNVAEKLLKREVKEEVNLEIKNIQYLTSISFIRPDNIPVVILSFHADYAGGEVELEEEALTEFAWVTLSEAKNYKLIEGIYEEIEMLEKKLKGERAGDWVKIG